MSHHGVCVRVNTSLLKTENITQEEIGQGHEGEQQQSWPGESGFVHKCVCVCVFVRVGGSNILTHQSRAMLHYSLDIPRSVLLMQQQCVCMCEGPGDSMGLHDVYVCLQVCTLRVLGSMFSSPAGISIILCLCCNYYGSLWVWEGHVIFFWRQVSHANKSCM